MQILNTRDTKFWDGALPLYIGHTLLILNKIIQYFIPLLISFLMFVLVFFRINKSQIINTQYIKDLYLNLKNRPKIVYTTGETFDL